MVTVNTLSSIQGEAGENKTFTSVSTNIIIKVGDNPVGAIKSLSVNEARTIAQIDEVGTDGHIDSVPSKSTNISGNCQRTRFDNLRVLPAFSRGFVHLASQRIPFDIDIIDTFAGPDAAQHITTTIKNIWVNKIEVTYKSDDFVIVENMDWEAEAIYSFLGSPTNNAVPSASGARSIVVRDSNAIELETDRGLRRGALNGFGLLQEFSQVG